MSKIRLLIILAIIGVIGYVVYVNINNRNIARSWAQPLSVTIYPLNDTGDPQIQAYINNVTINNFQPAIEFLQQQALHYNVQTKPLITLQLGTETADSNPPPAPSEGNNMLTDLVWSFKLRYWAYKTALFHQTQTNVTIFVFYQRYTNYQTLPPSHASGNSLIGVMYAYADASQEGLNNVLFANAFLRTLGAKDKYDPQTFLPIYPDGYAYPDYDPVYPQDQCEIMGLYIPTDKNHAKLPTDVSNCMVGPQTAHEVNWW